METAEPNLATELIEVLRLELDLLCAYRICFAPYQICFRESEIASDETDFSGAKPISLS